MGKWGFMGLGWLGVVLLASLSAHGQQGGGICFSPLSIDDSAFPVFHPNIDVPDVAANALQYYHAAPIFSVCPNNATSLGDCARATVQYAFGKYFHDQPYDAVSNPNRSISDGNSAFDVYFSDINSDADTGKPLAVVLHGGGGSKNANTQRALGIEYARRGYVAIVVDYTTPKDPFFGGKDAEFCSEAQFAFGLQYAIKDIRGAIRKAIHISSTSTGPASAKIDPTRIVLHGYSFGSISSLHLALMDADDFFGYYDSNTVVVNGTERTFTATMDDVKICPGNMPCQNYMPPAWAGQDLRTFIRGISFNAGFLFRESLLTPAFDVPLMLTHGTCDAAAPYHKATAAQALYRKAVQTNPNSTLLPENLPCFNEGDLSFDLFGSEYIYNKLQETMPTFENVGFLSVCGLPHAVNENYGLKPSSSNPALKMRPGIYETFRFFAEMLNNADVPAFRFDLDHSLRAPLDAGSCNAVPTPTGSDPLLGDYYTGLDSLCSRCVAGTGFNPQLRLPFFRKGTNTDANRYLPLASLIALPPYAQCNNCDEAPQLPLQAQAFEVKVLNAMGVQVKTLHFDREVSLQEVLRSGHGLERGFYVFCLGGGRQGVVVE